MKLHRLVLGIISCLSLALSVQAQGANLTTLDWKFSSVGTAGSPIAPTMPPAGTTTNETGGAASATFVLGSGNYRYFFGTVDEALYGNQNTGLWSMERSSTEKVPELDLVLDRTPLTTVDLTLVLTHFVDFSQFPGTVDFSPAVGSYVSYNRVTLVPQTGDMIGSWVADTWMWTGVGYPAWGMPNGAAISLALFPGIGNSGLLLDEVKLTISGAVATVPEPMVGQLAVLGMLAFGFRSWLRRRAAK